MSSTAVAELAPIPPGPLDGYPYPVRYEWRLMAEARAVNPSITNKELAQITGRASVTIASWSRSPAYLRYEHWVLKKTIEEVIPPSSEAPIKPKQFFEQHAHEMQCRLLDILDETTDHKLMVTIAHDWLDRSGHVALRREESRSPIIVLPPAAIEALITRAREVGLPAPIDIIGHPVEHSPGEGS